MIVFFKKNLLYFIGAIVGGISGFLYYQFVGCVSGTCAITSDPFKSTLYGILIGALLFSLFKKADRK